ncbi:hypothetical protein V1387_17990 [Allomuricauda taeanensis]|uniref:hypothetical protein n=1 Tax=Flagellimonas taeanensis TaxID=1005926 RepID=UPI002E7B8AF3|nr:hypothetical protein [Allomuricauda taeanensis]MEE1964584.1 hypothetical protein [Allomuricauda taeanensis]
MNFTHFIEFLREMLFPGGIGGKGGLNFYPNYLMPYAETLAISLVILLVGVQVVTYFANPSKDMDPYILIKPILIMTAMALYEDLVGLLLDRPAQLLTGITEEAAMKVTGAASIESFEKFFMDSLNSMKGTPDLWDILAWHPVLEVLHILLSLALLMVSLYIMIRQILSIAIYYILGIFVLPFSLIPGNQEILKRWFFGFLAVLLWLPILRIFQTIIIIIDFKGYNLGHGDFNPTAALASLTLQICGFFFILMTPKYANMLVSGSGDSDGNGWLMAIGRETYYRGLGGIGRSRSQRMGK